MSAMNVFARNKSPPANLAQEKGANMRKDMGAGGAKGLAGWPNGGKGGAPKYGAEGGGGVSITDNKEAGGKPIRLAREGRLMRLRSKAS